MKRLIILVFLLIGCETIIEIDIPEEEPRLVLNGFFNPDSSLKVLLYQSLGVLELGEFQEVSEANISIYNDQSKKEADLIYDGEGRYLSSFMPRAGVEYKIEASRSGFRTIESYDLIPEDSAKITLVDFKLEEKSYEGQNSGYYDISFMIEDYPGDDFYEVLVIDKTVYNENGQVHEDIRRQNLESEDEIFDDFNYSGELLLFGDSFFDKSNYTITVTTYLNFQYDCDEGCISRDVFLVVRKVSESYFKYYRTYRLQQDLNGNPFAEPVSVYNNISNGLGIFAGYRNSMLVLENPGD